MALGDLMHKRVSAALQQKRVTLTTDALPAVEEVDSEVVDTLERHVRKRGALVAGPRGTESYFHPFSRVRSHLMIKSNRSKEIVNTISALKSKT
jgi:hypothetical protein